MKAPFSFTEILSEPKIDIPEYRFIESFDSTPLAYYLFPAESASKNLIFIHGSGAHSMAGYQYLADSLSRETDVNVFLFDLRCHGQSGGKKGHANCAEEIMRDISYMIEFVSAQNGLPVFLGGHSWGASAVMNYVIYPYKKPVEGYVLLAPSLGVGRKYNKYPPRKHPYVRANIFRVMLSIFFGEQIFKHKPVLSLNYPDEILNGDSLITTEYNYPMLNSMMVRNPRHIFMRIDQPFCLLVGEDDELFITERYYEVFYHAKLSIRDRSKYCTVKGSKHISLILKSCREIAGFLDEIISSGQKKTGTLSERTG